LLLLFIAARADPLIAVSCLSWRAKAGAGTASFAGIEKAAAAVKFAGPFAVAVAGRFRHVFQLLDRESIPLARRA